MARNLNNIKIIQHNVLKWTFQRRNELCNLYFAYDPDIILLNATGIKDEVPIKIFNYNVHQKNKEGEDHAGVAVAIKKGIAYNIIDDFQEDVLAIKVETNKGPVIVATCYDPPRRAYFPTEDISRLHRKTIPVYFLGDLNVRHRFLGHRDNNLAGSIVNEWISRDLAIHMGPDFNTRVGVAGISRPDIILRNRNGFLNYAVQEGDLTTSDHIPIRFTIATTPIVVQGNKRRLYRRTNWENVQSKIQEDMRQKKEERDLKVNYRDITRNKIDKEISDWNNSIMKRIAEETPTTTIKYLPHPKESDLLKALQIAYNQIKTNLMTAEQRVLMRHIQEEIKIENLRLFDEAWERMINRLEIDRKDPKKFWGQIHRLMGGKGNGPSTYLWGANREKLYDDDKKLERYKEVWEKIFEITPEENRDYDLEHEETVTNYMVENVYRTVPYRLANLNRLNSEDPLSKPLEYFEMIKIIQKFKNKAPGETGSIK